MPEKEKQKQISTFIEWARKHLKKNARRFSDKPQRTYKHGDLLPVGNDTYILSIQYKNKKTSSARIIDNTIMLSVSAHLSDKAKAKHISTLLSRCIGRKRLPILEKKGFFLNIINPTGEAVQ